ncbi:hypothetical protein [Nocardioides sp. Soil796]|uniref:hypothetical protein n=1 Tax=Nocardioides sp. Soil796 TaxID=1736412 RepID=UPI000A91B9E7|nr:hypothetical protein [Nocardioides sp. Soil796]
MTDNVEDFCTICFAHVKPSQLKNHADWHAGLLTMPDVKKEIQRINKRKANGFFGD